MAETRTVKRYNTYYKGWRLAFGEHQAVYHEQREINWLFSEDRIGLALASGLRKRFYRELLGHHDLEPRLLLSEQSVGINDFVYSLTEGDDREGVRRLKQFLLDNESLHMFACSHFCYPSGTQIVTFCARRPSIILYKEMLPLTVVLD